MPENKAKTIYLKDYTPPRYLIDSINLRIELGDGDAEITAIMEFKQHPELEGSEPMVLLGEKLELLSVALNDAPLSESDYELTESALTIPHPPDFGTLTIKTRIKPRENTELQGIYESDAIICSQCEPEGFRHITYYPDRPDVMARFMTTLVGDKKRYPVMLSNGNPVASGDTNDGRHWVTWEDPWPKPSYLFATVAGDLAVIEDHFTTMSGKDVLLQIYVQPGNESKCQHAMASLKKAMKWDEEVYGREYDLDRFMVVSIGDFNMGAMENKGLNIFNAALILADPSSATDEDYDRIEGVIAHEYFHNWSGNRVTCRDWFQLSLKEGFTVFRDQQFSADMTHQAVKRIQDVAVLKAHQFREDAGPLAHPIRPASFVEINNFYTFTVYNKGAEVVRMLHTLLGPERFRKGTDLYFERHDGQAVTTDDFVRALENANEIDLTLFKRWYEQAGTPELSVTDDYDASSKTYELTVSQSCPPTPGQEEKLPFTIPLRMGLIGSDGNALDLNCTSLEYSTGKDGVLPITQAEETFTFTNVPSKPVPSLLRGFSAPAKLAYNYSDEDLAFLAKYDADDFNRWDAIQRLVFNIANRLISAYRNEEPLSEQPVLVEVFKGVLAADLDPRFRAEALALPTELAIAEQMNPVDPQAIHAVRQFLKKSLANTLYEQFMETHLANKTSGEFSNDGESIGRRAVANVCLSYLVNSDNKAGVELANEQFQAANNMTDQLTALALLTNFGGDYRKEALEAFYKQWEKDPLVVNKWLLVQSSSTHEDTLDRVEELKSHPAFSIKNPNKVRSLVAGLAMRNPSRFHDPSGRGYRFLADIVLELDPLNPQVAARMLTAMSDWKKFIPELGKLAKTELERILAAPKLSKNVQEIAGKSLDG